MWVYLWIFRNVIFVNFGEDGLTAIGANSFLKPCSMLMSMDYFLGIYMKVFLIGFPDPLNDFIPITSQGLQRYA